LATHELHFKIGAQSRAIPHVVASRVKCVSSRASP
jgi:hypothetical protein